MKRIRLPHIDPEQASREIGEFVINTLAEVGSTGCVIGLSGGVDSTTSAAIIKHAFDKHNKDDPTTPLELVGYILPSKTNDSADTEDGVLVAKRLGIRYEVHNIEDQIEVIRSIKPEIVDDRYDRGNHAARVRANVLSGLGAFENKTVAGTGNRDEDYGVGYYTLFGDGAVHFSPLGDLSKRLVREVATYIGFADLADRTPSAGLEPGQTDFKDLGYKYDIVELAMEGRDQGFTYDELKDHQQLTSAIWDQMIEYKKQYGEGKFRTPRDVIDDIAQRHAIAESKAKIISPPIAEVTKVYR